MLRQVAYPDCTSFQDFDPRLMLSQHNSRRSLSLYVASFENDDHPSNPNRAAYSVRGSVILSSKRMSRKATVQLGARYKLVGICLLQFELRIHFLLRSWVLSPSFTSNLTVSYLRSKDSPIFRACHTYDFGEVRYLLETGQASIRDVDETVGGLLEVC